MTTAALRALLVLGSLAAAAVAGAQVGHPAKGSWLGFWGPTDHDRRRILLLLDWEDREIVGTINPGRNAVPIDSVEIDYSTWTMTLEARMPLDGGGASRWVATGKLENLGSWVNRRYSGTYTHGGESGTFLVTLN